MSHGQFLTYRISRPPVFSHRKRHCNAMLHNGIAKVATISKVALWRYMPLRHWHSHKSSISFQVVTATVPTLPTKPIACGNRAPDALVGSSDRRTKTRVNSLWPHVVTSLELWLIRGMILFWPYFWLVNYTISFSQDIKYVHMTVFVYWHYWCYDKYHKNIVL